MHGDGKHPNEGVRFHKHHVKHCCKTGKGAHDIGCCTAVCQVPGCQTDLATEGKAYCRDRHICKEHMQADDIYCSSTGQHLRFCMQCGKLEPLSCFDGNKRSCRVKLQQRKERRRHGSGSDTTTNDAFSADRSHSDSHSLSSSACMLQADIIMAGEDGAALAASAAGAAAALQCCAPVSCSTQLEQVQLQQLLQVLNDVDMSGDTPACQDPVPSAQQLQQPLHSVRQLLLPGGSSGLPRAPAAGSPAAANSSLARRVRHMTHDGFEALLMQLLEEELTAAAAAEDAAHSSCMASSSIPSSGGSPGSSHSHQPGMLLPTRALGAAAEGTHGSMCALLQPDVAPGVFVQVPGSAANTPAAAVGPVLPRSMLASQVDSMLASQVDSTLAAQVDSILAAEQRACLEHAAKLAGLRHGLADNNRKLSAVLQAASAGRL